MISYYTILIILLLLIYIYIYIYIYMYIYIYIYNVILHSIKGQSSAGDLWGEWKPQPKPQSDWQPQG